MNYHSPLIVAIGRFSRTTSYVGGLLDFLVLEWRGYRQWPVISGWQSPGFAFTPVCLFPRLAFGSDLGLCGEAVPGPRWGLMRKKIW